MQNVVVYIAMVLLAAFIILSKIFPPIWLLLLIIAILWINRQNKNIRPLFLLSILFFILYFIFHYFSILVPFIIGFGFAYIFAPLVTLLEKKKIPRIIAILIFLIPIIAIFPLIITFIISGVVTELQGLIEKIPYGIQQIQVFSGAVINRLIELGIEINPDIISNTITSQLTNIISGIFTTIGQIGKGIGGIIMLIYNFILIPLSAYLFLSDREKIATWFRNLFGTADRKRVDQFINRLNISLARFFRGQLLLILVVGLIVGLSLWILGVRYYLLLGVIAGICNIIPNIGYILSFIPALLMGAISPNPGITVIKIICVYIGEQLLENFYLGPVIIGKSANLHPIVVMIVLILGGTIFGFWGVALAVPTTILLRESVNYFLNLNL